MAESTQSGQTIPEPGSSTGEAPLPLARARVSIDYPAAQLLAWTTLALLNQPLITLLLPAAGVKVRVLHQLYDAGQLLILGVASWAGVLALGSLGARWQAAWLTRWWSRGVVTGVVVLLVGLLTASNDVANLASRVEVPHWLLTTAMAATFALLLGASQLGRPLERARLRSLFATSALVIAVVNALTLKGNYFAHHLFTAWLAALLLARALEGLTLPVFLSRPQAAAALTAMASAGVLSVALPPKGDVRLRLYELPSSVLAPLAARFLSDEQGVTAAVIEKHRSSPWFRERAQLGPVPPTRAIVPAKPPIVMFFTIDAFRADVMENAEHRARLPELDRLRKESTYFSVARSPTASTMTTMASVFSGRYYTQLHWSSEKAKPLVEPTPRFPELVAANGVRTLLVAGTLGRIYGKSGVARGFSTEIVVPPKRQPATVTVDAIIAELDKQPDAAQLVYAHFIEPHAPYDLAGKKGTKFQRYVREIGLVDRQLGRLRAYLERKGLAERTYLIISADHGEGFGEHGTFNHAATAYEELVRVPLFFYLPGRQGRLLDTPVTLMDVGPTILDLFGLPTPGFWMGQSLLPLAAGSATKLERPVIVDTGRRVQAYCFDDGLKVIFARTKHTTEAYDLEKDPGELVNLAGKGDPAVDAAVQTAELFFRGILLPEMDEDFRE